MRHYGGKKGNKPQQEPIEEEDLVEAVGEIFENQDDINGADVKDVIEGAVSDIDTEDLAPKKKKKVTRGGPTGTTRDS